MRAKASGLHSPRGRSFRDGPRV